MSVTNGVDFKNCNIGNLLTNMYYYILDKDMIHADNNTNTSVYGYVPNIQSISFQPFADTNDFEIIKSEFNTTKYSDLTGAMPYVYRIKAQTNKRKTLKELELFKTKTRPREESKLQFYPYRYFLICDYINPPLLIKPQLVENSDNKLKLNVMYTISSTSKYNLYVERYKNDYQGQLEGMVNNNALLFPTSSSAYAEFLATSSASFSQSLENAKLENDLSLRQNAENTELNNNMNLVNSVTGVVGNLLNGKIGSAITTGVQGYENYLKNEQTSKHNIENLSLNRYEVEKNALAKVNDLLSTPRTMKSLGNDAIFNLENSDNKIDIIEMGIKDEYKMRIQNYFAKYGYKVNKYGIPNYKTRKDFNFVKTADCNIKSQTIPREDMLEIENIFNNGITFWHNTNNLLNYDVDNEEV